MSNISGNLNLAAFVHAIKDGKNGEKILMIPIKANNLMLTEKGNVYLDIQAFEIAPDKRKADRKDTHIVSQGLPKEKREALKALNPSQYPPTLGNLVDWGMAGGGEQQNDTGVAATDIMDVPAGDDDLPF